MRRTIVWLLYILMGVQIAFGCAYFASNFFVEQQFAENFVSIVPVWMSAVIQLALAAVSTWYFLGSLGPWKDGKRKYIRGYMCTFLLTVPFLLQMHLAKLIWSLSLSCFLWMTGLLLEMMEQGVTKKRIRLLAGAYFLYGIVCPDGLWLGGILLLFWAFFCLKEQGMKAAGADDEDSSDDILRADHADIERNADADREMEKEAGGQDLLKEKSRIGQKPRLCLLTLLTACAVFLANLGLNAAFPEARRIYRENNLGTAAVSRFVWPNFATNYFFWDEEVKEVLSEEDAVRFCQRVDLVPAEFYPAMAEAYGTGKATKLCLGMGYRCLMDRSRETVSEIGNDFVDHLLIPFTIEHNLRGEGRSVTGSLTAWNYGRMKARTPILVKYYYRYGSFELPFLLLGSLLLWWFHRSDQLGQWMKKKAEGKNAAFDRGGGKSSSMQWKFLGFTLILYTLWYTMRSNLPIDYKLVLPILFIWYLASIGGLLCQKAEN